MYCILNAFPLGLCDCCCDSWCGSWENSEFGLICVCVQGCTEWCVLGSVVMHSVAGVWKYANVLV